MPKIEIDLELCIGAGSCAYAAPDIFVLGDDGMPTAPAALDETSPELLEAVHLCPTGAIRLLE